MTAAVAGLGILAFLALLNYRLGGSVLYPPAQFALIWAVLLGASLFTAGSIFPLSVNAVTVFAVGAVAFSAGGALRLAIEQRTPSRETHPAERPIGRAVAVLLPAGLAALVALFPVFWQYLLSLADPRFDNFWWAIRSGVIAAAEVQGQKPWQQVLLDNITVAAVLLALTAMAHYGERGTSRLVALALVLVATIYGFATGSRAGGAMVLLGSLGIRMLRGRVSWRHAVAGLALVAAMYVPLTLLRAAKGGDVLSMAGDDMRVVGDTGLLYTVGPLAAFDAYLASPSTLTDTWSIWYFFQHAANRLGFDVVAPSTHMGYVVVGPQGATNVYTMYFAYYPEFGMAGVIVLSALVGFVLVWLYRAAGARGGCLLILYGLAFNEICKSGFNEGFFVGLNMWLKAGAYCLAIYGLQRISVRRAAAPRFTTLGLCCE
jgi:oligosaccharide repeat unit polymerase